jgi:hypothetical protein
MKHIKLLLTKRRLAHLSDIRHLGDSQAFLIVLRTSSRDGGDVPPVPTVDRKHVIELALEIHMRLILFDFVYLVLLSSIVPLPR